MLPRKFRLKRESFEGVIKKGKRLDAGAFTIIYIPGGNGALGGVVVPKKVCSKASVRNMLKRRLRAVLLEFLRTSPKGQYVLFAKKGVENVSFTALQVALKEVASKV